MVIIIMDLIIARIHIIFRGLQFEAGLLQQRLSVLDGQSETDNPLRNVFIIASLLPSLKLNDYVLCMFT